MNIKSLGKLSSIGFLFFCLALFFNGSKKQSSSALWTTCYNSKTQKIYFKALGRSTASKKCSGKASFKAPKKYTLITNSPSGVFSQQIAGTKRTIALKNGRKILATQWKKPGHSNRVIVLEPNLRTGKVKKHCSFANKGNAFATRFNHKINTFQVQVLTKNSKNQKCA